MKKEARLMYIYDDTRHKVERFMVRLSEFLSKNKACLIIDQDAQLYVKMDHLYFRMGEHMTLDSNLANVAPLGLTQKPPLPFSPAQRDVSWLRQQMEKAIIERDTMADELRGYVQLLERIVYEMQRKEFIKD